jgi:protein TonB
MDTATRPILTTTSLSLLLHALVIAGALLVYEQVATVDEGVGRGVEVQLISSVLVSDQLETDVPRKQEVKPEAVEVLTSMPGSQAIVTEDKPVEVDSKSAEQHDDAMQEQLSTFQGEDPAYAARSTNASQQQHTILELLHRRISDNKEYPYLARRQRREGVATVAFVLHPDGSIENAHLVVSSSARALDRAALSAVQQIEPFVVAKEYLKNSETFQVDIEFDLL